MAHSVKSILTLTPELERIAVYEPEGERVFINRVEELRESKSLLVSSETIGTYELNQDNLEQNSRKYKETKADMMCFYQED